LLRGLRKDDHITPHNLIKSIAFEPQEKSLEARKKENYQPPGHDISINWEDDAGALETLRNDINNAKAGVVRVQYHALIATLAAGVPELCERLVCERRALPTNAYHGNIVFLEGLEKRERLRLCGYLALQAQLVE
jgi:hypothetical protein